MRLHEMAKGAAVLGAIVAFVAFNWETGTALGLAACFVSALCAAFACLGPEAFEGGSAPAFEIAAVAAGTNAALLLGSLEPLRPELSVILSLVALAATAWGVVDEALADHSTTWIRRTPTGKGFPKSALR